MATGLRSFAGKATRWRLSTARLGRMQNGSAAVTADLVKYSLAAASTGTFVAQLVAVVIPAFEKSAAGTKADVLTLDLFPQSDSSP